MQPLTVENTELHFSSIYGTVYGHNKLSETHVTTTSNQHGRDHYSTSTTSKIIINNELWLRTNTNEEICVVLRGNYVPICNGHVVSVVTAKNIKTGHTAHCLLVNHSANRCHYVKDITSLSSGLGLTRLTGTTFALSILVTLLIGFLFDVVTGFIIGGILLLIFGILGVFKFSRMQRTEIILEDELRKNAKELLKKPLRS